MAHADTLEMILSQPLASGGELAQRTKKGQQTGERILVEATRIFADEGYAGLSMRKVADNLHITLSNLQHYFPSNEALLEAMISRVVDQYRSVFREQVERARGSREEQFRGIVHYLIEDIKQPLTQSIFLQIWALAQVNAYARAMLTEMYRFERSVLEFFINEFNPSLSKRECAQRAALIAVQIEGLMLLVPQQKKFTRELVGIEQQCMELIWIQIRAPSFAPEK